MVENPPSLAEWRQKLFDLTDTVLLSQEEFEMYFPWIDNIYTHRSTQHYKKRPFTSHYWDCRMKGRPPGTNKSLNNPLAKKRKRLVRELNLCDVKIKISEYRPECISDPQTTQELQALHLDPQKFGHLAQARKSFWTIQRINGNGTNGVGDQLPARHRHTLEKSDEIKKSSAARWISEREKLTKRSLKPSRWKPTGLAWPTAKKHREEQGPEVTRFYGACFCPFSQRVWIALEAKGIPYQYCETNPFNKPKPTHLLEANPRGLVPAIRQGEWACGESTVILEYVSSITHNPRKPKERKKERKKEKKKGGVLMCWYTQLEDIDSNVPPLHPTDPRLRANCRLWIDMINTKLVPSFYSLLKSTTPESQVEARDRLKKDLTALVQAADEAGPWFLGDQMCLVDIHFAPFALRLSRLLQQHRGWAPPAPESRLQKWIDAIEDNPHVRNTTSAHPLYNNTFELLVRGCQVQEAD
ncbi:hypothetical protein QBC46DRAFT_310712 [Diplogelasinospora grovesii]|uniref:Glutathione S-transferase n=1 Tax=Diplogelasinospora grovesii TaxID=303347 RepID=A0AAN6N9W0_9PEZI|nr:hypothetical protein QBC46DRAFT_310712 [Diplogelasinospora grovesii]